MTQGRRGGEGGHLAFLAIVVLAVLLARPVAEWLGDPPDPGAAPWQECRITLPERRILAEDHDVDLRIDPRGEVAYLSGTMTSAILCKLEALRMAHPEVTTLLLGTINGTIDEDRAMEAARRIREWGLDTHVAPGARVSSGGVTLFLGGNGRSLASGSALGVHSWAYSGGGPQGRELPRNHPEHQVYLDFYRDIGIDPEFYWFTLAAAGSNDIHPLTPDEIRRFGLVTRERPRAAVLR